MKAEVSAISATETTNDNQKAAVQEGPRRRGRPKAFVKVTGPERASTVEQVTAQRKDSLPDPGWLADFVLAVLSRR